MSGHSKWATIKHRKGAKDSSVPLDTIERAIKRGTGELEGVRYEAVNYEGYAPGGIAVIVETLTDNRNRTAAEVRNLFNKAGGSMAEPGAVSWQFDRKGTLLLAGSADEDAIMEAALDAGLENIDREGEQWRVTTGASELHAVTEALAAAGFEAIDPELTLVANQTVPITEVADAKKLLRLLENIDDHDDVQAVHANEDMAEDLLNAALEDG